MQIVGDISIMGEQIFHRLHYKPVDRHNRGLCASHVCNIPKELVHSLGVIVNRSRQSVHDIREFPAICP